MVLAGCGGRQPPLPDIAGPLPDVVLRAALAPADGSEAPPVQPLLVDTVSFSRLGAAAGAAPFAPPQLSAAIGRPFTPVHPGAVLLCPSREPCRVVDDGVYVEVWEAERDGGGLDVVVSRVENVQGLHVMTRSTTHRLRLRREASGWRLTARERIPD